MAVSIWTLKLGLIHTPCVAEKRETNLSSKLHTKTNATTFRHFTQNREE